MTDLADAYEHEPHTISFGRLAETGGGALDGRGDWLAGVRRLNEIAQARGLTLARLAVAWILRHETMTSVLIGASRPSQVLDAVAATQAAPFDAATLAEIDRIVAPLQP